MYSPENVGHFGLAYEAYTHFTSPIRRYPDLLVHRAIKAVLAGKPLRAGQTGTELGAHCSETERRADDATRDVEAWLKCYYMHDHVGEDVRRHHQRRDAVRLFVTLDDCLRRRPGAHLRARAATTSSSTPRSHHAASASAPRKRYRLADRVRVKVVRVDLETSKIDFVLAEIAERSRVSVTAVGGARRSAECEEPA